MNFDDFTVVDFPPINQETSRFVYVLSWVGESAHVPFYVGQTRRIWGRMDDYYWAMLSAPTDFRVGEAVRYLSAKGYRVLVKYKSVADSRASERDIIDHLHREIGSGRLLNDLKGFDWKSADESSERLRVQKFLIELLGGEVSN